MRLATGGADASMPSTADLISSLIVRVQTWQRDTELEARSAASRPRLLIPLVFRQFSPQTPGSVEGGACEAVLARLDSKPIVRPLSRRPESTAEDHDVESSDAVVLGPGDPLSPVAESDAPTPPRPVRLAPVVLAMEDYRTISGGPRIFAVEPRRSTSVPVCGRDDVGWVDRHREAPTVRRVAQLPVCHTRKASTSDQVGGTAERVHLSVGEDDSVCSDAIGTACVRGNTPADQTGPSAYAAY